MREIYSNLIGLSVGQLIVMSDSVLKTVINNNIHDDETKLLAINELNGRYLNDKQRGSNNER
jgi:hypothetical protein